MNNAEQAHFKRLRGLSLRRRLQLAWRLRRDQRVPPIAKIVLLVVIIYVLSPINVIPRWLPIVRKLDNLLIVAAGFWLLTKLIPPHLLEEHLNALEKRRAQLDGQS